MTEKLQINGQNFSLHPSGAMFWEEQEALLISDVHLGKISHFRKYGSAIPQKAIAENFRRLTAAVDYFNPVNLLFMGDLFHSSLNAEWDLFSSWIEEQSAKVILIAGNHDIISENKYEQLGIKIYSEISLNGILLTHHPEIREEHFNICGHLHPGFKLRGRGRQSLGLPCFHKMDRQLIMPAFGEFTGNFWISPAADDQIFAITKKEVILVS